MIRPLAVAVLITLSPLSPAAAVVVISQTPRALPAKAPVAISRPVDASAPMGMAFGEIVAALVGLAVLGLAMVNGRQPHSVTS